jgi:uncharacterized protein YybS (DUF2232 family)
MRGHRNSRGVSGAGVRPLAAGALLAALALLLGLASYYLPVVGGVLGFVMPLPIALALLRYDWRTALLTATVTGILALVIGGPLVGAFIASGCAVGLSLGFGFRRDWTGLRTLVLASMVGMACTVAGAVVTVVVLGPHTIELALAEWRQVISLAGQSLQAVGSDEMLAAWRASEAAMLAAPWTYLGIGLVGASFIYGWLWYSVCGPVLVRLGHPVPPLPRAAPVAVWRLPPLAGLAVIGLFVGMRYIIAGAAPGSPRFYTLATASSLAMLALMFQGFGLAAYLVARTGWPGPIRRPLIVLIGLLGYFTAPFSALLFWMGLFDLGLDIRGFARRQRPPAGAGRPE